MKDTVLKGTGNSRFLKSVEDFKTRYPTYDDFAAALVAGTLPIDLNGINAAGMDQVGTAINKANLLTDETATALGLKSSDDPSVNDALDRLATLTKITLDHIHTGARETAHSTADNLNHVKVTVAASAGNNALFAGGSDPYGRADVDAYTYALVHLTAPDLSEAKCRHAGASIVDYAVFGGGSGGPSVDAYRQTLVRTRLDDLSVRRSDLAAEASGAGILFGGGYDNSGAISYEVDAYDYAAGSLIKTTVTNLSVARRYLSATSSSSHCLFAGGNTASGASAVVDAYNYAGVRSAAADLDSARSYMAAAKVGHYGLFGGGTGISAVVDAYNYALVHSTAPSLSTARIYLAATSVEHCALFGGGMASSKNEPFDTVDVYDEELVRTTAQNLSAGRFELAAARAGNYALFAGGKIGNDHQSLVDAYKYDYTVDITIPRYSVYKFNGFHDEEQVTLTDLGWSSMGELSGYIKRGGFTLSGNITT